MDEKKFNCKMEDVPVIAGFVFASFESDKADFLKYSPVFADPFITNARAKQNESYEIVKSGDVLKSQKMVKVQISNKLSDFRLTLNRIEGYLKFANESLDIQLSDFGLKTIRAAIGDVNVEKVVSEVRSLIVNLKRNEMALMAKGMSPDTITALTTMMSEMEELNNIHNIKKNERSRAAVDNIKILNQLWDITGTILDAGRALYRGVDEVKLREYTMANLLKRVYNASGTSSTEDDPKKDALD